MVITYYFISSLSVLSFWFLVKDFYHQDDPASYVSGASQVRIPAMWTKRWVFPQVFSKARCSKMVGWNLLNIMISTNRKV